MKHLAIVLSCCAALTTPLSAQTFAGAYVECLPTSAPHCTGGAFYASQINAANKIDSFSQLDFSLAHSASGPRYSVVTNTRTGLSTELKVMGTASLWAFGSAGAATSGTSSSGSFGGGGFLVLPSKRWPGWALLPGIQVITSGVGGTTRMFFIAIGKDMPK